MTINSPSFFCRVVFCVLLGVAVPTQAITLRIDENTSDLLISGGLLGTDKDYSLAGHFSLDFLLTTSGVAIRFEDIDVIATSLDGSGARISVFPLTFPTDSYDGLNFSAYFEDSLNYYIDSYAGSFDGAWLQLSGSAEPMPILADATTSRYTIEARVVPLPGTSVLLISGLYAVLAAGVSRKNYVSRGRVAA